MTIKLENDLTLEQNQMLQALAQQTDWRKACEEAGVAPTAFRRWLRESAPFKKAYNKLYAGVLESARTQLEISAQKAADVFDEALDATKDVTIELKCPHCDGEIKVEARVTDHAMRMKAGEVVLKVGKILKDVKETSGTITIAALPLHLQLAYASYKRGETIPPHFEEDLREAGLIKALGSGVEEGEYREIDPTD
jgi:hypothetical protein